MCLGGSPKPPEVKYVGPSEKDIRRNEKSLETYQEQIAAQQTAFQNSLQQQIDEANAQTESLRAQYADDLTAAQQESAAGIARAEAAGLSDIAAAGASSAAQQASAYTVTAAQSEGLEQQTTAAIEKKKKPKRNLKISTAGTASSAGSGLNIGI